MGNVAGRFESHWECRLNKVKSVGSEAEVSFHRVIEAELVEVSRCVELDDIAVGEHSADDGLVGKLDAEKILLG